MSKSGSMNQNSEWRMYGGEECGGTWHWSLRIDAKWSALVSDHSQVSAPRQVTRYHPSAYCGSQLFGHAKYFDTLAEAKSVAIDFTMDLMERCPCMCEGHWIPDTGQYFHHWQCPLKQAK